MSSYEVIGLMSGSSLDGMDIVHVRFTKDEKWHYEILHTHCYAYSASFIDQLVHSKNLDVYGIASLHTTIAIHTADYVNEFISSYNINKKDILLLASHGQTIVHQPHRGFTLQLGCGATLAALTKINVVSDFRTKDVALGGQGAPMVPIGEKYLFPQYKVFLNIGGISNIAIHHPDAIIGYDVGPGNTLLNFLSRKAGSAYDAGGAMALQGKVERTLFQQLNTIPFYTFPIPKSMGTEYIEKNFFSAFDHLSISDALATAVEHIAFQIAHSINSYPFSSVFVTGGGAKNCFLIDRIKHYAPQKEIVTPEPIIIDYKEALIIGFAGLLRYLEKPNFLATVTGAKQDSVGGALYLWY